MHVVPGYMSVYCIVPDAQGNQKRTPDTLELGLHIVVRLDFGARDQNRVHYKSSECFLTS